jgi:hypothetical protein
MASVSSLRESVPPVSPPEADDGVGVERASRLPSTERDPMRGSKAVQSGVYFETTLPPYVWVVMIPSSTMNVSVQNS